MVYFPVTSFFFFKTSWDHNSNHFPDNNMNLFIKCIKSKDSHNYKSYRSLKVYLKSLELLLVQVEVCLNGASYCTTYHGVVTDTEEAYHFYVYSPQNLTSCKYYPACSIHRLVINSVICSMVISPFISLL